MSKDISIKPCKKCKEPVQKAIDKCPKCGEIYPAGIGLKRGVKMTVGFIIFVGVIGSYFDSKEDERSTVISSSSQGEFSKSVVTAQGDKWYQGNNLQGESALVWQKASYEDKLATSASIIYSAWQHDMLSPNFSSSISSIDSLRPLSEHLLNNLDAAFESEDDLALNSQIFSNQRVLDTAVILLSMDGILVSK